MYKVRLPQSLDLPCVEKSGTGGYPYVYRWEGPEPRVKENVKNQSFQSQWYEGRSVLSRLAKPGK